MRTLVPVLAIVFAGMLAPRVQAQSNAYSPRDRPSYYPYSVRVTVSVPPTTQNTGRGLTSLGLQTSVSVPDGGEALLGGYTAYSTGRNEFGTPLVGQVPYLGRLSRGVGGSSYEARSSRATVRVRVIRLADEEVRQTGVGR
jgi:hypothetical protein